MTWRAKAPAEQTKEVRRESRSCEDSSPRGGASWVGCGLPNARHRSAPSASVDTPAPSRRPRLRLRARGGLPWHSPLWTVNTGIEVKCEAEVVRPPPDERHSKAADS